MSEPLTVRFSQWERYDPMRDAEVVMFMGTTNLGSYHAQVVCERASQRRENRRKFEERVLELMEDGEPPQEVVLNG